MTKTANHPLFYKSPVPLQKEKHSEAGLSKDINYKFARNTNSIPITLQEVIIVAKFYPIVFTGDNFSLPVAVLGLENSKNVYINQKNQWEKGIYIPGYVRRYPFIFTEADNKLVLCVDEESDRYKKTATKDDDKFFNGGVGSEFVQTALKFCTEYHRDQLGSLKFSEALKEHNLIIERQINVSLEGKKKPIVLGGFKIIDEEKLPQLNDKTVLEWYKNGYLSLINFMIQSYSNWQNLVIRL